MVAVRKHVVLRRQEGAAGIHQVNARQPILLRDFLRAQVLLHRHWIVRAALHRRVVGDDHAFAARDAADAGDDARRGHVAAIHAISRERRQLEDRRAGIDEGIDAVARQQLAAGEVLLPRLFAAAARHLRGFLPQVGDQPSHHFRVGPEIVAAHVQLGFQGCHCALSAALGSLGQRRNCRFYHESRMPPRPGAFGVGGLAIRAPQQVQLSGAGIPRPLPAADFTAKLRTMTTTRRTKAATAPKPGTPLAKALHPVAERLAFGKSLRDKVPRGSHAQWSPPARRKDPVGMLAASSEGRVEHLLPIRHGRMLQSPFAFYRGAAAIMAADLAHTPRTGIRAQICGDCHLVNFGGFATPERRMIFAINDFDETLPGPWEWDVKRLVASFVVASRNNRLRTGDAREAALECARMYRERMARYADMRTLDVWYDRLDVAAVDEWLGDTAARRRLQRRREKMVAQSVAEHDFPKLVTVKGGAPRIRDNPPLIYHPAQAQDADFARNVKAAFADYRDTLADDRRHLLDHYVLVDIAQKVVGVGSVGTWCGVTLLMAGDADPLFLQVKEARTSVLEPYLGKSAYANRGQRVVMGQRLMQSASDVFLGWTAGKGGRHFYVRQLRDMKIKPLVETYDAETMAQYAGLCGWSLAHAHARSGDAALIAGYLGNGDAFDKAAASFGAHYADQNERDYEALKKAIADGRIEAQTEE